MATIPERGARCTPQTFEDGPGPLDIWQASGLYKGSLYLFYQAGQMGYSTRKLPGSTPTTYYPAQQDVAIAPKSGDAISPAPVLPAAPLKTRAVRPSGPVFVARPRMGIFDRHFRRAAKRYRIDEAYLRAVAHAESGYQSDAVSPKGAQGVMQLMPSTAAQYAVEDPFAPAQSINAGARHLAYLLRLYKGDRTLAAAAYNAGVDAVKKHKGVPPYTETRTYVHRVDALYKAYHVLLSP